MYPIKIIEHNLHVLCPLMYKIRKKTGFDCKKIQFFTRFSSVMVMMMNTVTIFGIKAFTTFVILNCKTPFQMTSVFFKFLVRIYWRYNKTNWFFAYILVKYL